METISVNEKRMEQVLPTNIKESDLVTKNAKKVLATIINYYFVLDEPKRLGYLYMNNETLRESCQIKKKSMLEAVQELIELGLIRRERGEKWTKGKKPTASRYYVNWNDLKKPIQKKTFEDLFDNFMQEFHPQEGLGPIDIDIELDLDLDKEIDKEKEIELEKDKEKEINLGINKEINKVVNNTVTNTVKSDNKINNIDNININNNLLNNNITYNNKIEEKENIIINNNIKEKEPLEVEVKEVKTLKDLTDYFNSKLKNVIPTVQNEKELQELQEQLLEELRTVWSHIPSFSNVKYVIKHAVEKKFEKLLLQGNGMEETDGGLVYTTFTSTLSA